MHFAQSNVNLASKLADLRLLETAQMLQNGNSFPLINYLTVHHAIITPLKQNKNINLWIEHFTFGYACIHVKNKLAIFKAEWNNISNDFQVLKRFIHTSGRHTNTHHTPKIFVYIYYNITHKYLVHRNDGTPYTGRWMWWEWNAKKWKVLEK